MWTLQRGLPVPAWRHSAEPADVRMAFSTRRGGVSAPPFDSLNLGRSTADFPEAVEENRSRFVGSLEGDPALVATVGQVHGAEVRVVDRPGSQGPGDALVTRREGLVLAVSAADCLPILMVGPKAVGAVHAGWRGAEAGVAEAALRSLCSLAGVGPKTIRIHFGPCIRPCCYQVGPDVAARFPAAALRDFAGSTRLDLAAAVRLRLVAAGAEATAIEDTAACTACEPHWYFSHRRDRGATGRLWGVIARKAGPGLTNR